MENSTTKAITIAVGIFVTVAITSGILFSINEIKNVYSQVYKTDTSMSSRFSELDAFDGTKVTGIDVINAINKYGDKVDRTSLSIPDSSATEEKKMEFYSKEFDSTVTITDEDNFTIKFSE